MTSTHANPLLQHHTFPPFKAIAANHIVAAVQTTTEENLALLQAQLSDLPSVTWANLVSPLEARDDKLNCLWSPVSHLNAVANSPEWREAYNQCLPLLSAYNTQMGQNSALFNAYQQLAQSEEFAQLNRVQQKAITNALRDFKLAGVDLDEADKKRYGEIQAQLSELSNQFSNNVLDATQGWYKHITDESQLAGMPKSAVDGARQTAENKGVEGWVLTLDGPVYLTVMTQAHDRALRQEMYTAYMTRASDQGPTAGQWDNSDIIQKILALRLELAQLLGFSQYGELSLAPKMAESCEQVVQFLEELATRAKPFAERELQELTAWVEETYGETEMAAWDIPYYSDKLKDAKYQISQERLRPYFTLPKVIDGVFGVASELFGIHICELENDQLWHEDARFYRIERDGQPIAYFYFDLFARPGKRGGAWMSECRVRRQTETGLRLPVAFLVCNFNPPQGDTPSLLTHNEVTTLFHEFGHGLHHMLTAVDVAAVSGINGVSWDAVELPSQFLENWAWAPSVLKQLSCHFETQEPLPDEMIQKLLAARNFQAAMMTLRQTEFALFDLRLHMEFGTESFKGVQALLDEVRSKVAVFVPPGFNRFQNGFTHIFAGGYAAGYYSYKWAEVLSADAFSLFEENGLFDRETGNRFLNTILQSGGSEDAMTLFKAFRGREPKIDALLRHSGLSDQQLGLGNEH